MTTHERSWWWVKEKKQMALVFILVTVMLQSQIKGCVGCLESERTGLLELKSYLMNVLNDKDESILKSWSHDDSNSDCCVWESIKCNDSIGGHIVDLSLYYIMPNNLDVLPPRSLNLSLLHGFPQLKTFRFSGSYFTHLFDPIHGYKSFQRLKNLRNLDLSHNSLNISVLPFLSAARSLRKLNLKANNLDGVFPPNGLRNLTQLEELNLSFNRLNIYDFRADHKSFQRLGKLRTLDLSYSKHNNCVLPFLSAARSLRTLYLDGNNLEGLTNMNVFKDLPNLQELDLYGNQFNDLDSLGAVLPSSLQALSLGNNHLSFLPKGYSEICRLLYLRELDLSRNALTNMPYCLGNLSRLRTLDLSYNQLNGSGKVSSFVYALPSTLEYLSLLDINLNGSFLFKSLVNKTRLAVFKLSSNVGLIQAQVESSWVPLFQLKRLELHNFNLGSTIPGFLIHQHDLSFVNLSHNNLTGAFPIWLLQNNTRLQMLFMDDNSLNKLQLPRLAHGLEVLNISSNRIFDSIQEDIWKVFPNLTYMNFASNHFHGAIPSSMGKMKSLRMLDMSSNRLYGQLPETFLSNCYSLKILKLSNNQFGGEVFPEYANLTGLVVLVLGGNNFTGSLGKGLLNSKSLRLLNVSDNCISGDLPLWIERMSSLQYLNVRGNQLKGLFPRQLQNLALVVLDISHNSFSGSIPRNFNPSFLKELRLQSNEFEGSIPDILFNAKQLELLDLRNNNLSGLILNTVSENSTLRVLLLRNNSLQSCIPKKICQLSGVGLLDLSYNKLEDAMPSCLGTMFSSEERPEDIWIIRQQNTGGVVLTQNWGYTSAILFDGYWDDYPLQPGSIVDFITKGRYEAYHGDIIGDLYGLDLSSNQLSGEIPMEIGNLLNITSLNFSNNQLTGSIPDSISKLKVLESLDLSNNKLDGSIPPQLADLNSLGYFNVSYNNFSGEIPINGHLLTFGEKSYVGNPLLCGLPTKISCNPTRSSKQAKEEEEEESDGVIDMEWFYWTCGAVYISTVLALFAFLCIDSHGSREWFYRVDLLIHHLQRLTARFLWN